MIPTPPKFCMVTLYCHSGNEAVLSIDPNALAIITLLHWREVQFEIVSCSHISESPTSTQTTTLHGYSSIMRALKEFGVIPIDQEEDKSFLSLTRREFILQMNQDLLVDEFNNDEIFRNFTEPALLLAKSRYYWNFACSRLFPLNCQVNAGIPTSLKISLKQRLEEMRKIASDQDIGLECKLLLLSHLLIRFQLPEQDQLLGFEQFYDSIAAEFEKKDFKGKIDGECVKAPVYKHQFVEEYKHSSCLTVNAYTGLFGVILAVAVLYSIKNR